jgi:hypothetical protein
MALSWRNKKKNPKRKISTYKKKSPLIYPQPNYECNVPPSLRAGVCGSEETDRGNVWEHPQILGKFMGNGGMSRFLA